LELYTCRNCGTAYGRAYTDDVDDPNFLWSEPGGAFRTLSGQFKELSPIDLLLENQYSLRLRNQPSTIWSRAGSTHRIWEAEIVKFTCVAAVQRAGMARMKFARQARGSFGRARSVVKAQHLDDQVCKITKPRVTSHFKRSSQNRSKFNHRAPSLRRDSPRYEAGKCWCFPIRARQQLG